MPAAVFVLLHQSGRGGCPVGLCLCWGIVRFLGQSFLLPLEGAIPVLVFGLIELFFPFTRCLLAGFAGMPFGVTPNAVNGAIVLAVPMRAQRGPTDGRSDDWRRLGGSTRRATAG